MHTVLVGQFGGRSLGNEGIGLLARVAELLGLLPQRSQPVLPHCIVICGLLPDTRSFRALSTQS
jgi:hypothetical protein